MPKTLAQGGQPLQDGEENKQVHPEYRICDLRLLYEATLWGPFLTLGLPPMLRFDRRTLGSRDYEAPSTTTLSMY